MSTGHVILIVIVALIALLAIGGLIANARRQRARAGAFHAGVEEANRRLAEAHAQDKGWEPSIVNDAARRLFAESAPGDEVTALDLVQVVDEPGTDQDKAVFRVVTPAGVRYLTLGRRGGEWVAERLS